MKKKCPFNNNITQKAPSPLKVFNQGKHASFHSKKKKKKKRKKKPSDFVLPTIHLNIARKQSSCTIIPYR